MRRNILSIAPLNSDATRQKLNGTEIGNILQFAVPIPLDIRLYIKLSFLAGCIGQQKSIIISRNHSGQSRLYPRCVGKPA